ncbi:MAG: DNA-deoxyinosine glycosylase [Phycisphaerae bacterium]|jgi:hypoxanthine-DNA glycosylase
MVFDRFKYHRPKKGLFLSTFQSAKDIIRYLQNGIAVWDVLKYCQRKGSGDLAIEGEIANDFNVFFYEYSKIRKVFFNGQNAEKFYRRLVLPSLVEKYQNIAYKTLPSTSPANAHKDFQTKLKEWYALSGRN